MDSNVGSVKWEGIHSVPPTGARGETFVVKRHKQSKDIIRLATA